MVDAMPGCVWGWLRPRRAAASRAAQAGGLGKREAGEPAPCLSHQPGVPRCGINHLARAAGSRAWCGLHSQCSQFWEQSGSSSWPPGTAAATTAGATDSRRRLLGNAWGAAVAAPYAFCPRASRSTSLVPFVGRHLLVTVRLVPRTFLVLRADLSQSLWLRRRLHLLVWMATLLSVHLRVLAAPGGSQTR